MSDEIWTRVIEFTAAITAIIGLNKGLNISLNRRIKKLEDAPNKVSESDCKSYRNNCPLTIHISVMQKQYTDIKDHLIRINDKLDRAIEREILK